MRRLYIFDEYASSLQNGIGTYITDLKRHLAEVMEVSVLSFNDTVRHYRKDVCDGVTYYRFPAFCGGSFLDNCEVGLTVLRLEIADSPGNVFLLNYYLCNDLLRALKEYYPQSKTVFVIHDQIWTERLLGDGRKLKEIMLTPNVESNSQHTMLRSQVLKERRMYRLADRVITVSKDTLALLKSIYGLSPEKISHIPHGKDIKAAESKKCTSERLRKKMLLDADEKILLYVGRTTRAKGFYAALSAFEKVAQVIPRVKLIVLGRMHDLGEVVRLCPRSKARIVFAGLVGKEELKKWYQVADIGLVPSYSEQCSYVGIEMMAHGLPVFASSSTRAFRAISPPACATSLCS